MAIAIVLTDECALVHAHARTFLKIEPESDFGTIEGRLLNVGDGAVFVLTKERHLVGGIGEEIALEDGVCSLEFRELEKLVFGSIDAFTCASKVSLLASMEMKACASSTASSPSEKTDS